MHAYVHARTHFSNINPKNIKIYTRIPTWPKYLNHNKMRNVYLRSENTPVASQHNKNIYFVLQAKYNELILGSRKY